VAGLQGGCAYLLRARASGSRGTSDWGAVMEASTRQWPSGGGGGGPGYTWGQTAEEVTIAIEVRCAARPGRCMAALCHGPPQPLPEGRAAAAAVGS
jgi:hypothetical protein